VAYNDEYTVGVWLGNQQGAASRSLIGAKSAAPLVAKIFNKLYPSGVPPFRQSDLLTNREVCAVSGLLPVKYCLKKTMTSTGAGVELLSCRQHLHNTEIDTKGSFEIHSPEGGNYSCIDQLRLQLKSTDKGSWFINGKYCGVGNSWRNFSKGSYTIRCVAAHEVASVEIVVR
jgi:membrane carboxypeptidase/penicillin-binding protein PbpC